MPDEHPNRLIGAIWRVNTAIIEAQGEAAEAGDTEALAVLSLLREWTRITLRRHGENTIRQD